MKKIFTLLCIAVASVSAFAADTYVSAGDGTTYTFEALSKIPSAGVTLVDGAWQCDSNITISAGDVLKLQNKEVVKFGTSVQISVVTVDFEVSERATITAVDPANKAKGFRCVDDNASVKCKNVDFEYIGFNVGTTNGKFTAENCTFTKHNGSNPSSSMVNFSKTSNGHVIKNCVFQDCQRAGVAAGSNTPVGITISNCEFRNNVTANRNNPQINLTAGGSADQVLIENCKLVGGHYTLSGGIAVSNMLGLTIGTKVIIKDNDVRENRYGINITGGMISEIIDNTIVDNIYETNPQNGGSAISIYDAAGKGTCKIRGNYMENNLWGITVIDGSSNGTGGSEVDAGTAEDYGYNHFVSNGNGDPMVRYEFYNNTSKPQTAVGNFWYCDNPADVIFKKEGGGDVEYSPVAPPSAVDDVNVGKEVSGVKFYNLQGVQSNEPFDGVNIIVTTYSDGTTNTVKMMK